MAKKNKKKKIKVTKLPVASSSTNIDRYNARWDGDKFMFGFGDTSLYWIDYWTLRDRSNQLWDENSSAKGLLKRMLTNEISSGLSPEASPNADVLMMNEDKVLEWSNEV